MEVLDRLKNIRKRLLKVKSDDEDEEGIKILYEEKVMQNREFRDIHIQYVKGAVGSYGINVTGRTGEDALKLFKEVKEEVERE